MENSYDLGSRIKYLEKENTYLKELLSQAGISYEKLTLETKKENDISNQGRSIIPKEVITGDDANLFFRMFWGRTDLYSQRTIKKSTGAVNYYPQCNKFWKSGCPIYHGSIKHCSMCVSPSFRKLDKEQIINHLLGNKADATDVIGIYPLLPDDTCRFIVFDFDNHEKGSDKTEFSNIDETWKEEIDSLREICQVNGIDALVERSRSGRGAHLWIFFQNKIDASLARKFGNALLTKGAETVNLKSFRFYDRMLPMQDHMPKRGFGNLIALPLQGQALKNGNSAFVDANWNVYPDQWKILLSKKKLSKECIETKMNEWKLLNPLDYVEQNEIRKEIDEKPWEKSRNFHLEDINGAMDMVLANAIYIDTKNLKPRIQNQIRKLAAFSNPIFYKNQAMGISNFENFRYIYLGEDEKGYIRIPRGLLEQLLELNKRATITSNLDDRRCKGIPIDVSFSGELKCSQIPAVEALVAKDVGILNAATAFGKTVVCCNIIARKKVNTLILLQSSSLMEQWVNALNKFLVIKEELPEYRTPSGRTRKRKSIIGTLQGAHDSTTGIIDIAMVGSICKKGEYHHRLKDYGMVILDECHHAASDTIVDVLQEVCAKHVYGVTATPFRGDGMEKINYMLLGPIRYRFTSKDRAKEQGIDHWVYPRFTRAVAPRFDNDRMHPNEAYAIIRENEDRDKLIVNDVKKCIEEGRTPVILSKYVDHAKKLYDCLEGCADKTFLLLGNNSKKEHREILQQMDRVQLDESMVLIATGKLIGEGFDFPRLDTLIMATPVAWKGIVEQYAGRLNRDYEGKKNVIIYDYVDSHIPMFDRMYHKRLKAYKQIGYDIYIEDNTLLANGYKDVNAIFDIDTYLEVAQNDMLSAKNEIVISSPALSGNKVDELVELLKEKQLSGVHIVIVTWKPDAYGYGDSVYWMELQERMRRSGFEMNLVEDYCNHYCIIDKEIVWYGSLNFLGKEDSEDNLMRVCSKHIASELLEMTFGRGKYIGESM